ncbi:hypothetical protein PMIN03_012407 [Paraphaeosphaeria minitans]
MINSAMTSLNDRVEQITQQLRALLNRNDQGYTMQVEGQEQDVSEVIILCIIRDRNICFYIAITCTNTDIENAKAVCSQAVVYRSTYNDPNLYLAVYDTATQMVWFCLLNSAQLEYEDVAYKSMERQASEATEMFQAFLASSSQVLR